MELIKNDHQDVQGWGADAEKTQRPAHVMWKTPEHGTGAHWSDPEQQPGFNDFVSIERPRPTRVFGNTVPPSGLSGIIRKIAFQKSEGTFSHWMLLILADRINVFEGIFDDVTKGIRPRFLEERGWRVDKKFKTRRYYKVMGFSLIAVTGISLLFIKWAKERKTTHS
jgi:hypothetical protein